jgi:hypothetical protein
MTAKGQNAILVRQRVYKCWALVARFGERSCLMLHLKARPAAVARLGKEEYQTGTRCAIAQQSSITLTMKNDRFKVKKVILLR